MRRVYLFCDEFTNYPDSAIGIQAVRLLHVLGYDVVIPKHVESGRAALSKGLLRRSRRLARENLRRLAPLITPETPMVGIEPSAILCFRDEYVDLVPEEELAEARRLATCSLLIDEFLAREIDRGFIRREQFTREPKKIKLHGHCQQKALCGLTDTVKILSFPENFEVETLPTGCCGMAGSFGYEREHFDLSMQIGGLVLFPALRGLSPDVEIAASGTSCRHQIHDGLGIRAKHPVEILFEALDPGLLAATFHPS
jgi:Fe-S oxidoreductase